MSSLSTLPKGDSAWLLRKSIQRIMQQVSVLETNIGSSTTGNSSNTQVIFNDNGTLRGDAGLTYNAATDTLSTGSATITGDLTVDTSTLKVDSANDRVGIGTASPAQFVHLSKSSTSTALTAPPVGGASLRIQNTSSTNNNFGSVEFYNANGLFGGSVNCQFTNQATPTNDLVFVTRGSSGGLEHYRIAADGVCTWSEVGGVAGTAMTLNSTGLGIGVSPSNNLHVQGASGATAIRISAVTDGTLGFIGSASGLISGSPANNLVVRAENGLYLSGGGNATQFILTSSGNVGIGVTPSAWVAGAKALQFGAYGSLAQSSSGNIELSFNSYNSGAGAYKYLQTDTASLYRASSVHSWFVAPSGTAGNAITFTQAMTLDASGNLLVGKTSSSLGVVGVEARPNGEVWSTNAASTDGAGSSYILYSTGATAYRFYVGMGGTVFATNTTISAISDARLKENVQDIDVGLGAILALKPRKFDWKAGKGKDIKGDRGFIAQEFETVFPNLIDEWKDEAPEGEAPYKSVRQDLIPVLVKAIQELTARVQTLEAK